MKKRVQLILIVVLCGAQFAKAQTVIDVTDIANYPYAAYLEYTGGGSGNGAIISDTQVVTSASVLDTPPSTQINVYVGNAVRRAGTVFKSKYFQKHPNYNSANLDNNVAIVTINGTFNGLPNVTPISVQTSANVIPVNCFSIGWGVRVNGSSSTFLRRVNYQLVTDQECATKLGAQPSTIQCASAMKGLGIFEVVALPLVCDNQLYGLHAKLYGSTFTDAQPIDIFARLTAVSIQDFLFPKAPRRNYVSCN